MESYLNMEGINLFLKILVFVKILSQCKEDEFQSLEVRDVSSLHLKTKETILNNPININWDFTFLLFGKDTALKFEGHVLKGFGQARFYIILLPLEFDRLIKANFVSKQFQISLWQFLKRW